MCGIAGYINFNKSVSNSAEVADKLLAGIKHRGLDDNGVYIDNNVILQHTRLSIIDLKTGHQPMFDASEKYIIVFNGEIFNYEEIRKELISKGYKFNTNSDTEVLLNSYIEWGWACQNKFNGFWAFCIYDIVKKTVFVSRDRYGIKPLFYKQTTDEFIFSSEIQTILDISSSAINSNELWDEILFGSKNGGATSYNGINELEPGTYIILNLKDNSFSINRYYDILNNFLEPKKDLHLDEIEHLLKDSIKLRLRADVPLGTLNSGGLDSSYISAVVKKDFNIPLNTFSVAPDLTKDGKLKNGDESYFAEFLAKHIQSNHTTIRYSDNQYFDLLEFVNNADGSFMSHPNTVALYFMLKYIKEKTGIKVLLGGDGADEIFRGYSNNMYAAFLAPTSKIPLLSNVASNVFRKKFKNSIVDIIHDKYSLIQCLAIAHGNQRINGNKITQLLGISGEMSKDRVKLLEKSKSLSEYDQVIYYEQSCYLSGHLKRVDRMSMRAGIEIRLPFLDYRLVENLNKLHFRDKFSFGESNKKKLLKKIGKKYLPDEILFRAKKGFSSPIDHYRSQTESYIHEKYKLNVLELKSLNDQELFILMNVLNKYQLK